MSIEAMKRIKSLLQDTKMIDSHTISAVVAECDMAILAQQPAQAVNEKHFGDFELLVVTTAYEQGFGHAFRTELSNPYAPATNAYKAWDMGRSAGKRNGQPQQPATGEPVACATPDGLKSNWHAHHAIVNKAALQMVRNALRNDVERGLKVRGEMLAELDSATFQAHPAPSVPDDVVRDAERYRWLRDHDHWPAPFSSSQEPEPVRGHDLDAAIDAAMLAAAPHPQQPKEPS